MQRIRFSPLKVMLMVMCVSGAASVMGAAPKPIQLPGETVKLKPSNLPGFTIAQQKCAICHSADYIAYQPPGMTVTQWTAEMTKMQHLYGAPIDEREIKLLGIYLAATYGDATSVTAADRAMTAAVPVAAAEAKSNAPGTSPVPSEGAGVQALLSANACLGCHAVAQKIVGPSYKEVTAKYKSEPNAVEKLKASIKSGSAGKWGPVPMPPFPQLTDTQLKTLAEFVLKQ